MLSFCGNIYEAGHSNLVCNTLSGREGTTLKIWPNYDKFSEVKCKECGQIKVFDNF